jgi:ribose transport system substrate-binding protein
MIWKTTAWFSLVAMIAAGCSSGGSSSDNAAPQTGGTTTQAPQKKDIKITMMGKSNNNPVFQSAKVGAEKAAEDIGKKDGIKITIDWQTPDTEDAQVQASRIAQAVNNGADAILISCQDAGKVTQAINEAVAKGVPVMTFDSDAPDSKRFAFYGADDTKVGTQLMDEIAGIAKGKPLEVAILAGNPNAPNLQKRSQGVIDEAKKYPNVKIVGQPFHHIETPQDATAEVTRDNQAHPEINAWAMIGGWPLFNSSLLSLDPSRYTIVSVDALPGELPYVEKGVVPVLLAQPTFDWGYKSVGFIVDKLQGKNVDTINVMQLTRVSKDNLGDWARQLKDWGFTDVDPKYLALPPAKK